MRHIQNVYYRIVEVFSRLVGDTIAADYYAAKREGNR